MLEPVGGRLIRNRILHSLKDPPHKILIDKERMGNFTVAKSDSYDLK